MYKIRTIAIDTCNRPLTASTSNCTTSARTHTKDTTNVTQIHSAAQPCDRSLPLLSPFPSSSLTCHSDAGDGRTRVCRLLLSPQLLLRVRRRAVVALARPFARTLAVLGAVALLLTLERRRARCGALMLLTAAALLRRAALEVDGMGTQASWMRGVMTAVVRRLTHTSQTYQQHRQRHSE